MLFLVKALVQILKIYNLRHHPLLLHQKLHLILHPLLLNNLMILNIVSVAKYYF